MRTPFLAIDVIREYAGREASSALPDEYAESLPIVTRANGEVVAVIFYFPMTGRPPNPPKVGPPTHIMRLDGRTGRVIRFGQITQAELVSAQVLPRVPRAGDGLEDGIDKFLERRKRFFELSPEIWSAFEDGGSIANNFDKSQLANYYELFLQIVLPEVAPFYVLIAPDFFQWINVALKMR